MCLGDLSILTAQRYFSNSKNFVGLGHESVDKIRDVLWSVLRSAVDYGLIETMRRLVTKSSFTFFEVTGALVAAFGTMLLTERVGFTQKWVAGLTETVIVFYIVIFAFRPSWNYPHLWRNALFLFVLHIVGLVIVMNAILVGIRRFPWGVTIPASIVEGILILGILWKWTAPREHAKGE